nr:hypothetical protein Iba_chr12fCG7670 [Ipomoea batatas]
MALKWSSPYWHYTQPNCPWSLGHEWVVIDNLNTTSRQPMLVPSFHPISRDADWRLAARRASDADGERREQLRR